MSEGINAVAFYFLSALTLVSVIGMLTTKSIMRSGYWLLAFSVLAAAVFFLLDANYLALVQLLVYAGAVSIIVIFSIMITVRNRDDLSRSQNLSRAALIISAIFCGVLIAIVLNLEFVQAVMPHTAPSLVDFGKILFSPHGWALPFEIASVILTVALVGAVWWSGREE